MKNIGVLIPYLASEYSISILNGISSFFKNKNVRLIIIHTDYPHGSKGLYDYQCWTSTCYLNTNELDAIIVVTGEYTSTISIPKLSLALNQFSKIPVISVGQELFLQKNHFTQVDCRTAYKEVIGHLHKKHGCRKIAFLSANLTSSEEAIERYESFKLGLSANNLPFDYNLVIDGNYTETYAYNEIHKKYKTAQDVNFDAILCANDSSACGCLNALKDLGVKVPEDVKIIGFDNFIIASLNEPKLSTLEQDFYIQGSLAAELTFKTVSDKNQKQQRIIQTPVTPIYRQSCGCISLENKDDVYRNHSGKLCIGQNINIGRIALSKNYNNFLDDTKRIYSLFDLVRSDNTLEKLFQTFPYLMDKSDISQIELCLLENPVKLKAKDDFVLPKDMYVSMLIDNDKKILNFEPDIHFNPHKKLFHESSFSFEDGSYILNPIFSGEVNYGYILCKLKGTINASYCIFMRIINNAITQAYQNTINLSENQKLAEENLRLSNDNMDFNIKKQIDSMTKLLNRHGFYNLCQQRIDLSTSNGQTGLVISANLDHLKEINAKFGKPLGDIAIKAMATVLAKTFRANDIIGRLNGDDFAIVSTGINLDNIPKIKYKIDKQCYEITLEKKLPFLISISMGCTEFSLGSRKLKLLLSEATRNMAFEKKQNRLEKHSLVLMDDENINSVSENTSYAVFPDKNMNNGTETQIDSIDELEELEEILDIDE